jgi:hypothetical protein
MTEFSTGSPGHEAASKFEIVIYGDIGYTILLITVKYVGMI